MKKVLFSIVIATSAMLSVSTYADTSKVYVNGIGYVSTEYSENSITGVRLCTPTHVKANQCSAVDQEYYTRIAKMNHGSYAISTMQAEVDGVAIDAIAVLGSLSTGFSNNLETVLDQNPNINHIIFSSAGGDPREGQLTFRLLSERNMTGIVPPARACMSACADAFLGTTRQIVRGQLGFHSTWYNIPDQYSVRDLEAANNTIANIVNELQINNTVTIMNRIEAGYDPEFSLYVAKQEGTFVIFDNELDLVAVKNGAVIEDHSTVRSNDEISAVVASQKVSESNNQTFRVIDYMIVIDTN